MQKTKRQSKTEKKYPSSSDYVKVRGEVAIRMDVPEKVPEKLDALAKSLHTTRTNMLRQLLTALSSHPKAKQIFLNTLKTMPDAHQ